MKNVVQLFGISLIFVIYFNVINNDCLLLKHDNNRPFFAQENENEYQLSATNFDNDNPILLHRNLSIIFSHSPVSLLKYIPNKLYQAGKIHNTLLTIECSYYIKRFKSVLIQLRYACTIFPFHYFW